MIMRLLGDRVLVALPPRTHEQDAVSGYAYKSGDVTESGLILATRADAYDPDLSTRGIVMQVGERRGLVDIDDVRSDVHSFWLKLSSQIQSLTPDGTLEMPARSVRDELDRVLMKMAPAAFDVQIGDCVVFSANAGSGFEQDGVTYAILREDDIIGILEPKKDAAA